MPSSRIAVLCNVAVALLASAALAQPDALEVTIGDTFAPADTGGLANTAAVNVSFVYGPDAPSTVVLFLTYDPDKLAPAEQEFELTRVDLEGNPVRDDNDNVIVERSAVRLSDAAAAANKGVDTEAHPEGAFAVTVRGGESAIPMGTVFTVAFSLLEAVQEFEAIPIGLAVLNDPVLLENDRGEFVNSFSTASTADFMSLPFEVDEGSIEVGCVPPEAPTNVQASQGMPDAVVVTWNAVQAADVEYRVYRSTSMNDDNPQPLGESWQRETTFTDVTALAPPGAGGGCLPGCPGESLPVEFFYFVRARFASTQCPGALSAPSSEPGFRGKARAVVENAEIALTALPAKSDLLGPAEASGVTPLAIPVRASDPATVSAFVWSASGEVVAAKAEWAANSSGGWVRVTPQTAWPVGETIYVEATAGDVRQVRSFDIVADKDASTNVTPVADTAYPLLTRGVGPVYAVGGDALYAAPHRIALPIPSGEDPNRIALYVWREVGGDRQWYRADTVSGLLAGAPSVVTNDDGTRHLVAPLNHGAIVQVGHVDDYLASSAAVWTPTARGDAAVFFAIVLLFVWAGARQWRPRPVKG